MIRSLFARSGGAIAIAMVAVLVASCSSGGSTSNTPQGVASPKSSPSVAPSSSASSAPSSSPSSSASSAPSASPSSSGSSGDGLPYFTFDGGSDSDSCTPALTMSCSAPPLVSVDGAVQVTATFPSTATAESSSAIQLFIQVATGTSQISPAASFPAFTGTGTVEAYIALNSGTATGSAGASGSVSYTATPSIVVNGVSGSTCNVYVYANGSGSTYAWQSGIYPQESVSSGSVSFPAGTPTGSGTLTFTGQESLLAIACS